MMTFKITTDDGKYTFINNNGVVSILRYDQEWDTGNKAMLSLLHVIEDLTEEIQTLKPTQNKSHEVIIAVDAVSVDDAIAYARLNASFSALTFLCVKDNPASLYGKTYLFEGQSQDISGLLSLGDVGVYNKHT